MPGTGPEDAVVPVGGGWLSSACHKLTSAVSGLLPSTPRQKAVVGCAVAGGGVILALTTVAMQTTGPFNDAEKAVFGVLGGLAGAVIGGTAGTIFPVTETQSASQNV